MDDDQLSSLQLPTMATLNRSLSVATRLLVSVRSADEARAALLAGVDILDVKEPSEGSLGMASPKTIGEIASLLATSSSVRLSVALGEVTEWRDRIRSVSLPGEVAFGKLGMSGLADQADWVNEWIAVRSRIDRERDVELNWVAVAYADSEAADSPPIESIFEAASATNCCGLLIDTFSKSGGALLDFCTPDELKSLAVRCHSSGMFLALAGRLSRDTIPRLTGIGADVVAIRSAACEQSDRRLAISSRAIVSFRESLNQFTEATREPCDQGSCCWQALLS